MISHISTLSNIYMTSLCCERKFKLFTFKFYILSIKMYKEIDQKLLLRVGTEVIILGEWGNILPKTGRYPKIVCHSIIVFNIYIFLISTCNTLNNAYNLSTMIWYWHFHFYEWGVQTFEGKGMTRLGQRKIQNPSPPTISAPSNYYKVVANSMFIFNVMLIQHA